MFDIVFRGVSIVNGEAVLQTDVAIKGGRIEKIAPSIGGPCRREIVAEGLYLLPGAIDLHAHLREPGLTHKEDIATGTMAAVASGITTIFDMPNTLPPTTTYERLIEKSAIAARSAQCNVRFFMALTSDNLDEIERAMTHKAFGGVKVFLGSTTGGLLVTDVTIIEKALDRIPALFAFHGELEPLLAPPKDLPPLADASHHHLVRPVEAALQGLRLIADVSRGRTAKAHVCHLSSAPEVELLRTLLRQGFTNLSAEVCPHHLYFTFEDTQRLGNLLKVNPPIRGPEDQMALRTALADGTIAVVATDHAPHTLAEKASSYQKAPSGVPGVDTLVPAILGLVKAKVLTLGRAVDALSTRPARIAGLSDRGLLAEGYVADLMLLDLSSSWTPRHEDILSKCRWTPFEGVTLAARPLAVFVSGQEVFTAKPASL